MCKGQEAVSFREEKYLSSSEESLPSSVQSEEYAHVPIEAEKINELTEKFDQIGNLANMEELTAQVQLLTQQLALVNSKQTEQDSEVNQLRVSNQATSSIIMTIMQPCRLFRSPAGSFQIQSKESKILMETNDNLTPG